MTSGRNILAFGILMLGCTSAVLAQASVPIAAPFDTVWTIESGSYAGTRVPIDISAALGSPKRDHFWRLAKGSAVSAGLVGWKSTRYPIPLAFRHGRKSREISSDDSGAFWTILDEMNSDFGFSVFRPATLNGDDPDDVIVVDVGMLREADGYSRITWAPSGELFDVRVTFQDSRVLHDAHVVTHEMMHALGFGHTAAWRSVVAVQNPAKTARVTEYDVAYAEMAMHSRIARERIDTRGLIALAVSRERHRSSEVERYDACEPSMDDIPELETSMNGRGFIPVGLLAVVSACSSGDKPKGPDTIAVPAAAVDTTTDRLPGNTPRAEAPPATGVDTPITHKLGSPAPLKK